MSWLNVFTGEWNRAYLAIATGSHYSFHYSPVAGAARNRREGKGLRVAAGGIPVRGWMRVSDRGLRQSENISTRVSASEGKRDWAAVGGPRS